MRMVNFHNVRPSRCRSSSDYYRSLLGYRWTSVGSIYIICTSSYRGKGRKGGRTRRNRDWTSSRRNNCHSLRGTIDSNVLLLLTLYNMSSSLHRNNHGRSRSGWWYHCRCGGTHLYAGCTDQLLLFHKHIILSAIALKLFPSIVKYLHQLFLAETLKFFAISMTQLSQMVC